MSKIIIFIGSKEINYDEESILAKAEHQLEEGKTVIFYNIIYNNNIMKCINKLAKKHNVPIVFRVIISNL